MDKDIRCWLFVGIAFLLGSINVLYHSLFLIFLSISLVVNVLSDKKAFFRNVKANWIYLSLPILGVIYLIINYLLSYCLEFYRCQGSWSVLEILLLYFFLIPVYVVSIKKYISIRLLKKFMLGLCWGIVVFNFVKFFYITRLDFFSTPLQNIQAIYNSRFGGNMDILNGFVLLEPQAFYLAVSAVISSFFLFQCVLLHNWRSTFWSSCVIFLFSLLFLSFTVTKASILAFGCSFLFLLIILIHKLSLKWQFILIGIVLLFIMGGYWGMPDAFRERISQAQTEIVKLQQGQLEGGTIAPRVALWKESFSHFNEWGIWGLGFYEKYAVRSWNDQSPYLQIHGLRNTHNSFLNFWILGGIPGLLFILFYFFVSLLKMFRLRQYSTCLVALLITLVVTNNTCFLAGLTDSAPLVVMILAISFIYLEYFVALEKNRLIV